VALAQTAAQQQIAGEHMVIQDGTVNLGIYGKVYVTGMTEKEAREAIETHLAQFIDEPQVAVDVYSFNSKKYYIVTEGGGLGDGVYPFPVTGNETVLDAIAQVNGLDSVASARIWIARPAPNDLGHAQVLPVDWYAITRLADTSTNYQLMPGDRVYVAADKLVKLDAMMAKVIAPFERLMGATLLTTSTVSRLEFYRQFGQRGGAAGIIQP
jgi:polysaccharide export outer membrane protein